MTSGPFAISGSLFGDVTSTTTGTDVDGSPMTPVLQTRNAKFRSREYFRPKSTSVIPTESHWREPTAWYNRGYFQVTRPAGQFVVRHTSPNWPKFHQYTVLADGYGLPDWGLSLPTVDVDKMVDIAVTKCLLKLKNQHVDLSVAFSERKECVRQFENLSRLIVTDIAGFKQSLNGRRLVFRKREKPPRFVTELRSRHLPRDLHDKYLEMVYGWIPFMSDLYGSMEGLAYREKDQSAYRQTVVSSIRDIRTGEPLRLNALVNSGIPETILSSGWDAYVRRTTAVHISLTYEMVNPLLKSLAQWGVTNPLLTAYQLTRFSFVLDWMLPVSNYLSCLDATFGYRFKGGTRTIFTRAEADFQEFEAGVGHDYYKNDFYVLQNRISEKPVWRSWNHDRVKYISSPLPRVPRFKNPFSGIHVANAVALVRGALHSRL